MIRKNVPSAEIEGHVGRRTSFEVTVDGELIHSKLSTNSFPDFEEVVSIVQSVNEGSKPQQVQHLLLTYEMDSLKHNVLVSVDFL
uniref:Uncharacterized protein n=1 Tax=Daphnia galeata TaxID=27404 RepID=A0A8J2WMR2_9CRUS|nr:unnamed protein product [Daphnia galeata]